MNMEQEVLNAFERGKAFGFAEGMKSMRLKELTDEEIEEVEKSCKKPLASWAWKVEFARAILRKAQEK